MEAYKSEFIEFMVESEVRGVYLKKRQEIPVFYECGGLCDRIPADASGRVLCQSDS